MFFSQVECVGQLGGLPFFYHKNMIKQLY